MDADGKNNQIVLLKLSHSCLSCFKSVEYFSVQNPRELYRVESALQFLPFSRFSSPFFSLPLFVFSVFRASSASFSVLCR